MAKTKSLQNERLDRYIEPEDAYAESIANDLLGGSVNSVTIKYSTDAVSTAEEVLIRAAKRLSEAVGSEKVLIITKDEQRAKQLQKVVVGDIKTIRQAMYSATSADREKLLDSQVVSLLAYNSLPAMSREVKIELAKEMASALEYLLGKGIRPEEMVKNKDKLHGYLLNSKAEATIRNKFTERLSPTELANLGDIFVNFVSAYIRFKEQGYIDSLDISEKFKKEFNGMPNTKYVIVFDASDMSEAEQEALAKIKEHMPTIIGAAEGSLLSFAGANFSLEPLEKAKASIEYFTKNKELKLVGGKKEATATAFVVDKHAVGRAAVEIALKESEAAKVAILAETNFLAEQVRQEIEFANMQTQNRQLTYRASIRLTNDEGLIRETQMFIEGLLAPDSNKQAIVRAMKTVLSPVPFSTVKAKEKDFENNQEVGEFASFMELRKTAQQGLSGAVEVLEERLKAYIEEQASQPEKNYAMLATLSRLFNSLELAKKIGIELEQLPAWVALTPDPPYRIEVENSNDPKILIATPYSKLAGKADVVIYASISYPRSANAIEYIANSLELIIKGKSTHEEAGEIEKAKVATLALKDNGKFVYLSDNPEKAKEILQALKAPLRVERMEISSIETPSLKPQLNEVIRAYFTALNTISFSLLEALTKHPDEFLERYVLGLEESDELAELGEIAHQKLAELFKSGKAEVDEAITPLIKNAEKVMQSLKDQGYFQTDSEKLLTASLNALKRIKEPFFIGENELVDWNPVVKGFADAIFEKKDGSILILDFKTGKSKEYDEKYNYHAQLMFYAMLYSVATGTPLSKIELGIAHIGLREEFEDFTKARYELHMLNSEERRNALKNLREMLLQAYAYYKEPGLFINRLSQYRSLSALYRK